MKKVYADLHLCANLDDLEQTSRLINKASLLGYGVAAIPFPQRTPEEQTGEVKRICEKAGIDLVRRIDLRPHTPEELTNYLRKLRRRFEVIGVLCESKNVARQAAKDRRVDLLNFPQLDFHRRFFDRAEAELASHSLTSLEIDVKPLLILDGIARTRLLSALRKEATIAQEHHVPIVISSGISDKLLLRKPLDLASMTSLFDLSITSATEAISKNPLQIVKRNREKLSSQFVAPGIRIVRRGKDC